MSAEDKKPELLATPEQAQVVVDEVDRITKNIKLLPGLIGIKNNTAPKKLCWHEDVFFVRWPDGESNIDDSDSINMATVAWDNEDGSRTSYTSELTLMGMQLSKHTYLPMDSEQPESFDDAQKALSEGDYTRLALNAAKALSSAQRDHLARQDERAMGLHRANVDEANELITKLQSLQPAPERLY